jgi:hypothetical protein
MKMSNENKTEAKRNVLVRKSFVQGDDGIPVLRIHDAKDKDTFTDYSTVSLTFAVRSELLLWGLYEKLSDSKAGDKPKTYSEAVTAMDGKWESILKGDMRVNTPREAGKAKAELATAKADKAKLESDNQAKQAQIDGLNAMMLEMKEQMAAMMASQSKGKTEKGKTEKGKVDAKPSA